MNYKPDEATLVAYFYRELEPAEYEKVERYLAQNPEERRRLGEWSFTNKVMAGLPDKEVIAPPIFLGDGVSHRSIWNEKYFRMTLGIAASLLFLLVASWMLGLSASYSQGELKIGFGSREKTQIESVSALTEDRVNEMIQSSLVKNTDQVQGAWSEGRQSLEQSMQKNLVANSAKVDRFVQSASTANQEQVRNFVSQMQNDNLKLMKEYMQLSAAGQKEYIGGLMVDFSKYLQEQRKQDLQLFQVRMNNIEENTDQLKQETSQILTSLINPGSTAGNNTRRN